MLHGGMGITTRYSLAYICFNLFLRLMVISGLCRTRNPCSSSFCQSFLVGTNNLFYFLQRYESGLVNLQSGDDWQEMCATTPGHIQGKDFDGPTSCAYWVS